MDSIDRVIGKAGPTAVQGAQTLNTIQTYDIDGDVSTVQGSCEYCQKAKSMFNPADVSGSAEGDDVAREIIEDAELKQQSNYKIALLKALAKALNESFNLNIAVESKNLEDLARDISKSFDLAKNRNMTKDPAVQRKIVQTLARVLNQYFPELIDASGDINYVLTQVSDLIFSISAGCFRDYLLAAGGIRRTIDNMTVISRVLELGIKNTRERGGDSDVQRNMVYAEKLRQVLDSQIANLRALIGSSMSDMEKRLVDRLDKESARGPFIKALQLRGTGDQKFADAIKEVFRGIGGLYYIAPEVARFLEKTGKTVGELRKFKNFREVEDFVAKSGDLKDTNVKDLLEDLRAIYEAPEVSGSAQRRQRRARVRESSKVEGSAEETKIERMIENDNSRRQVVFTLFARQVVQAYEAIGNEFAKVVDKVRSGEIRPTSYLEEFNNAMSNMGNNAWFNSNNAKVILGYYKDADATRERERFLVSLRQVVRGIDAAEDMQNHFVSVRQAINNLIDLLEKNSDKIAEVYGSDEVIGSGLDDNYISKSANKINLLIKQFVMLYALSKQVTMIKVQADTKTSSEDYQKTLGSAIADKIDELKKKYQVFVDNIGKINTDEKVNLRISVAAAENMKDRKAYFENMRQIIKERVDDKIRFYKFIEAFDIFLDRFSLKAAQNIALFEKLSKLIEEYDVINDVYSDKTGNDLVMMFESPLTDASTDKFDSTAHTKTRDALNNAEHYYKLLDDTHSTSAAPYASTNAQPNEYDIRSVTNAGNDQNFPTMGYNTRYTLLTDYDNYRKYVDARFDKFYGNLALVKNFFSALFNIGEKVLTKEEMPQTPMAMYTAFSSVLRQASFRIMMYRTDVTQIDLNKSDPATFANMCRNYPNGALTATAGLTAAAPALAPIVQNYPEVSPVTLISPEIVGGAFLSALDTKDVLTGADKTNRALAITYYTPLAGLGEEFYNFGGEYALIQHFIKAAVTKLMVTIGMSKIYRQPTRVNEIFNFRSIVGSADSPIPEILPEAGKLYFYVNLLIAFYRRIMDQCIKQITDRKFVLLPEFGEYMFKSLFELVFNKLTYVKDSEYSTEDAKQIITEINRIYAKCKEKFPSDPIMGCINQLIKDANTVLGVLTTEEQTKLSEYRSGRYDRQTNPGLDDAENRQYSILPGEDDIGRSSILPSDMYATGPLDQRDGKTLSSVKLEPAVHMKVINQFVKIINNMIDTKADHNLNDISAYTQTLQKIVGDIKEADTPDKKFELALSLVRCNLAGPSLKGIMSILYHDLVLTGLDILNDKVAYVRNMLAEFNELDLDHQFQLTDEEVGYPAANNASFDEVVALTGRSNLNPRPMPYSQDMERVTGAKALLRVNKDKTLSVWVRKQAANPIEMMNETLYLGKVNGKDIEYSDLDKELNFNAVTALPANELALAAKKYLITEALIRDVATRLVDDLNRDLGQVVSGIMGDYARAMGGGAPAIGYVINAITDMQNRLINIPQKDTILVPNTNNNFINVALNKFYHDPEKTLAYARELGGADLDTNIIIASAVAMQLFYSHLHIQSVNTILRVKAMRHGAPHEMAKVTVRDLIVSTFCNSRLMFKQFISFINRYSIKGSVEIKITSAQDVVFNYSQFQESFSNILNEVQQYMNVLSFAVDSARVNQDTTRYAQFKDLYNQMFAAANNDRQLALSGISSRINTYFTRYISKCNRKYQLDINALEQSGSIDLMDSTYGPNNKNYGDFTTHFVKRNSIGLAGLVPVSVNGRNVDLPNDIFTRLDDAKVSMQSPLIENRSNLFDPRDVLYMFSKCVNYRPVMMVQVTKEGKTIYDPSAAIVGDDYKMVLGDFAESEYALYRFNELLSKFIQSVYDQSSEKVLQQLFGSFATAFSTFINFNGRQYPDTLADLTPIEYAVKQKVSKTNVDLVVNTYSLTNLAKFNTDERLAVLQTKAFLNDSFYRAHAERYTGLRSPLGDDIEQRRSAYDDGAMITPIKDMHKSSIADNFREFVGRASVQIKSLGQFVDYVMSEEKFKLRRVGDAVPDTIVSSSNASLLRKFFVLKGKDNTLTHLFTTFSEMPDAAKENLRGLLPYYATMWDSLKDNIENIKNVISAIPDMYCKPASAPNKSIKDVPALVDELMKNNKFNMCRHIFNPHKINTMSDLLVDNFDAEDYAIIGMARQYALTRETNPGMALAVAPGIETVETFMENTVTSDNSRLLIHGYDDFESTPAGPYGGSQKRIKFDPFDVYANLSFGDTSDTRYARSYAAGADTGNAVNSLAKDINRLVYVYSSIKSRAEQLSKNSSLYKWSKKLNITAKYLEVLIATILKTNTRDAFTSFMSSSTGDSLVPLLKAVFYSQTIPLLDDNAPGIYFLIGNDNPVENRPTLNLTNLIPAVYPEQAFNLIKNSTNSPMRLVLNSTGFVARSIASAYTEALIMYDKDIKYDMAVSKGIKVYQWIYMWILRQAYDAGMLKYDASAAPDANDRDKTVRFFSWTDLKQLVTNTGFKNEFTNSIDITRRNIVTLLSDDIRNLYEGRRINYAESSGRFMTIPIETANALFGGTAVTGDQYNIMTGNIDVSRTNSFNNPVFTTTGASGVANRMPAILAFSSNYMNNNTGAGFQLNRYHITDALNKIVKAMRTELNESQDICEHVYKCNLGLDMSKDMDVEDPRSIARLMMNISNVDVAGGNRAIMLPVKEVIQASAIAAFVERENCVLNFNYVVSDNEAQFKGFTVSSLVALAKKIDNTVNGDALTGSALFARFNGLRLACQLENFARIAHRARVGAVPTGTIQFGGPTTHAQINTQLEAMLNDPKIMEYALKESVSSSMNITLNLLGLDNLSSLAYEATMADINNSLTFHSRDLMKGASLALVDTLIRGCDTLSKAARDVLTSINDQPKMCEFSATFAGDYFAANKKKPFMPLSQANYYSLNKVAKPVYQFGTAQFKLLYGLRGVLPTTGELKSAALVGPVDELGKYNSVAKKSFTIGENEFVASANEYLSALRRAFSYRVKALISSGCEPVVGQMVMNFPPGSLEYQKPCAIDLDEGNAPAGYKPIADPIRVKNVTGIQVESMMTYQANPNILPEQVVSVSENTTQDDEYSKIITCVSTQQAIGTTGNFESLTRNVLLDLAIMPIDVSIIKKDIPLANLYVYSANFEQIASNYLLYNMRNINAMADKQRIIDFLVNYEDQTLDLKKSIMQIFSGNNAMITNDKIRFIHDQLFNKVLIKQRLVGVDSRFMASAADFTDPGYAAVLARVMQNDPNIDNVRIQVGETNTSAEPTKLTYLDKNGQFKEVTSRLYNILSTEGTNRMNSFAVRTIMYISLLYAMIQERLNQELNEPMSVLAYGNFAADPSVLEMRGIEPVNVRNNYQM
jgi:hypothetical protein